MEFAEPIIHLDMDAFFVECERLADAGLRDRPVVVGGAGRRGVVAAASYEARRFGVRSAMPMARARALCPELTIVAPDHRRYQELSREVFAILRQVTPLVEAVSVDEAFLDVSGLRRHHPSAVAVASLVRTRIRDELGLPSSAGVASNKLLAKLASEEAKPDGLLVVPRDEQLAFLHSLPVRRLWGVGEAAYAALERLGVDTVGAVARLPERTVVRALGESAGRALYALSWGRDDRPVTVDHPAKSVSVEVTYEEDLRDEAIVRNEVLRLATKVAGRLRRAGLAGRTITLKVRYADFTTPTRSVTLAAPTDVARDIHRAGLQLLERIDHAGRAIRLLGVGVSGLDDASAPRQLAVDRPAKWDDLEAAVGTVRDRFGDDAIRPASLGPLAPESHPE